MMNNLITVTYMLILLGIVIVINTILGVVMANKKVNFKWSIFFSGLCKALVIALCILLFCLTLELMPIVLEPVGIKVSDNTITTLEIILTTLTAYKKYASDCFDKFKTILKIEGE